MSREHLVQRPLTICRRLASVTALREPCGFAKAWSQRPCLSLALSSSVLAVISAPQLYPQLAVRPEMVCMAAGCLCTLRDGNPRGC